MPVKHQIRVGVYFTPYQIDEMQLKDKNVVVIDVLRASTSIATALRSGAKEIVPVNNIESAVKISGSLFGDVVLRAGERNARMIEGFNLGNSPAEYSEEVVRGKTIIFLSTNGSVAMVKGRHASRLIVAGFINLSSVVEFLAGLRGDFVILCAGKENAFCIEDAVCAGRIVNLLSKEQGLELLPDDAGLAAATLDKLLGKNVLKLLKMSEHGRYLTGIGFGDDLKLCAAIDSVDVLPAMAGNVIRDLKANQSHGGSKR